MNTTVPKGMKGISTPALRVGMRMLNVYGTVKSIEREGRNYVITLERSRMDGDRVIRCSRNRGLIVAA